MEIKKIGWIAGGIICLVIGLTLYWELNPTYEEDVTVNTDTQTTIDSLKSIITYYENIPPAQQDTIRDTLTVTKYVQLNDSTREYKSNYVDSTISATVTTQVVGEMTSQEFEYYIRNRLVKQITNTITKHETTTVEKIITRTRQPQPYFFVGGEAGTHALGPIVGYSNAKQYSFFYRYDINTNSHNVGVTIPIKFNLNPFK